MARSRVERLFRLARDHAARRLPWLADVGLTLCDYADRLHRERWRFFAHSGHLDVYTVCFARAAERELRDAEVLGISAHEFGHVVALQDGFPEHLRHTKRHPAVEREANWIAERVLGFRGLRYNRRTLQEVPLRLFRGSAGRPQAR